METNVQFFDCYIFFFNIRYVEMWKMWNAEKSIYKKNMHNVNHDILTFHYEKEPWLK